MSNRDHEGSHPSNRDVALERAWRDASAEQPPSNLDAALIAAAHKAVPDRGKQPNTTVPGRSPSRNWLTQWQPLVAAAAVTGLAFILVQMLPREPTSTPSMQRNDRIAVKVPQGRAQRVHPLSHRIRHARALRPLHIRPRRQHPLNPNREELQARDQPDRRRRKDARRKRQQFHSCE